MTVHGSQNSTGSFTLQSMLGVSTRDVSMRDVSIGSLARQARWDMSICSLGERSILDVTMHDVLRRTISDVFMTDAVVSIAADLEKTAGMAISVIGRFEAPRSGDLLRFKSLWVSDKVFGANVEATR